MAAAEPRKMHLLPQHIKNTPLGSIKRECFVGDLEPIEYLAAYDQNDRLKYDWELVMHYAPKKIYYAHANEKIL